MAFITKTEAGAIFTASVAAAVAGLPKKLDDAIRDAAARGNVTVTFNYFPATSAQADAFIAGTLTPQGWTAVNNNIATPGNFTITVS